MSYHRSATWIVAALLSIMLLLGVAYAVSAQERPPVGIQRPGVVIPAPPVTQYEPPQPTAIPPAIAPLPTEQWYPTPDNAVYDCPGAIIFIVGRMRLIE